MKKIFLLLIFLNSFIFSAIDESKIDVYFGNGILTKEKSAKDNAKLLENSIKQKFGLDYYHKHIGKVDYAYNHTEGQIADLIESAKQITNLQEWLDKLSILFKKTKKNIHYLDLKLQVDKYEASIKKGHRVLVVAHSQGNLFAHEAFERLGDRGES